MPFYNGEGVLELPPVSNPWVHDCGSDTPSLK
jgi:hypothetical protein